MGSRGQYQKAKKSYFKGLLFQKKEIESKFDCFKCEIKRNTLICTGYLQPTDDVPLCKVLITQKFGKTPKVFILDPKIEYNSKIHMYKDKRLCLFYPKEFKWKKTTSIAEYLIPWTNEWIILFELYKITGEWQGKEAPHGRIK